MFQGEPGQMPGRGIDSEFLDQPTRWKMFPKPTRWKKYLPWLVEETWARAWVKKKLRNSRLLSSREGFTNSF